MRRWGLVLRCATAAAFFVAAQVAAQAGVPEHAPGTPGVTVVTDQSGGEVSLKVDAVLEVRLEANHTTGYSWITAPVANPVLARQGEGKVSGALDGRQGGSGWRGDMAIQGSEGRKAGFVV